MIEIQLIETTDEFSTLKVEWNKLLSNSEADTIFLTWEWAFSWWEAFHNVDTSLFILIVMDNKKLVAIAPLFITKRLFLGFFGIKEINFLGAKIVSGEYLDFIIDSSRDEGEVLSLIFKYIENHTRQWDLLRLTDIPEKSINFQHATSIAEDRRYWFARKDKGVCPFVVLPSSWQSLKRSFPKKLRKNFEYQQRRLQDRLGVTFNLHNQNQIEADINIFFELHEKLWNSKGQSGAFTNQRKRQFYHAIALRFSEEKWLRLWFLKDGHVPIAALFGIQYNNKFYYLQSGHDPAWSKYSVAQVLITCIFENIITEGCSEFDFLRGAEPYKYKWGAVDRKKVTYEFSRRNARTILFHTMSFMKNKFWK